MVNAHRRPSRAGVVTSVLCVSVLAAGGSAGRAAQAPLQRQVFASVTSPDGSPVLDVIAGDVKVTEDGQDCEVLKVDPIEWPTKVTMLVDNGTPSTAYLSSLRTGLQAFFGQMPQGVEASLVGLAPQPRFIVRPTSERDKLAKSVDLVVPDKQVAKFFDGLAEAADRIDKDKTKSFPIIVLVVSDVTSRAVPIDYEVTRLQKRIEDHAVTVHVVILSTGAAAPSGYLQRQLGQSITTLTGGRYEDINSSTRITPLLTEIGGQIAQKALRQSHQYRITYQPPPGREKTAGAISVNVAGRIGTGVKLSLDGRLP